MTHGSKTHPGADRRRAGRAATPGGVLESARRLGVELDEAEAAQWVAALEAEAVGRRRRRRRRQRRLRPPRLDARLHAARTSRASARSARSSASTDRPPDVPTALALSGSAAQSKVQSLPGRLRLLRADPHHRPDARRRLRDPRATSCARRRSRRVVGPTYRLWEVKFGELPVRRRARRQRRARPGGPISWTADEVAAGADHRDPGRRARDADPWDDARRPEPGWCKLDWIVADPARRALANASNMLDVTWEAPDGDDHAARRLHRPLLPGGLPRGRVAAAVQAARRRSSRPTRSTTTSTQLEHEVVKYAHQGPNTTARSRAGCTTSSG